MARATHSALALLLCALFLFSARVLAVSAVLGVDLGTEYIKASLVKPGIPLEIVLTKDSRRKETSAVAFKPPKNGPKSGEYPERAYGSDAMALTARFPGDVYPNLKALLGLPADQAEVKEYAARHPDLQLQADKLRNTVAFKSKGAFAPDEEAWLVEELLAMELQSIRSNAEALAGADAKVRSVVLTVPSFYTLQEKRAIQLAAELAGLRVLSLISDGLAVGLNYATTRQFPNINEGGKPETHMVFDMGAGSTKATVLKFQSRTVKDVGKFNKTVQEVKVLGSGWDRTLGGDALNALLIDDMIKEFVASSAAKAASVSAEGVKGHGRAVAKISKEAERLRQVLSANSNGQVSFEGLYDDVDFKYKTSRATFEKMAASHAARVGEVFGDALDSAGLTADDLDSVILHGGATRTPFVQKELETILGSAEKIRSNVNSDEAAVFGAGFRAAELSPSFRVKEIRTSEAATYTAGMKWKGQNGRPHHQRLWTGASFLGAGAKEETFSNLEDFSVEFYQSVPFPASPTVSKDQPISVLSTKNLTATVEELQDKYSCEMPDIQFKVALRLSSEAGEVEVVRATVQCEVEETEKEGFVDGVKNLFGFGKKDQQPLKDGEDSSSEAAAESVVLEPESSSSSSADESASTTSTASSASDSAAASPDAADDKEQTKKMKLITVPVEFTLEKAGVPQLSKTAVADLKDRLKAFEGSDRARRQREEALNQLEAYTYKVRDLLDNADFLACATAKEKAALEKANQAASEWLYGDGTDASRDDLKARHKALQDVVEPIQVRAEEGPKRPELIADLRDALNQSRSFVDRIKDQIAEMEAWNAKLAGSTIPSESSSSSSSSSSAASESSATDSEAPAITPAPSADPFAGLEDDEYSGIVRRSTGLQMEDVLKERGPVPPLYSVDDLREVEELTVAIEAWLDEKTAEQDKLGATDDPALRLKDIQERRDKLSKAGVDLAMKGVKNFESKEKKKEKKSSKSAKSSKTKKSKSGSAKTKSSSSQAPGQTIELKPNADGSWPSDEEIAELLKQYGVEKEQHDAKKDSSKKTNKKAAAADGGDEDQPVEGVKLGKASSEFKAEGRKHEEL